MAVWTPTAIHATGDVLPVTDWNNLANDATFLYQAPYGSAYDSAGTSINSVASVASHVGLATAEFTGYGVTLSSSNLVVSVAGTYYVTGGISINYNGSTGILQTSFAQNGAIVKKGNMCPNNSVMATTTVSGIIKCSVNDQIGLYCIQTSGSAQTLLTGPTNTYLQAFFIGSI